MLLQKCMIFFIYGMQKEIFRKMPKLHLSILFIFEQKQSNDYVLAWLYKCMNDQKKKKTCVREIERRSGVNMRLNGHLWGKLVEMPVLSQMVILKFIRSKIDSNYIFLTCSKNLKVDSIAQII